MFKSRSVLGKVNAPLKHHPAVIWLKRQPATVFLYNGLLDLCCRDVQGYIFVATTGRSGTTSLCRVLEQAVDGAICFHEPHPIMFSDYSREKHVDREEYFRHLFFTQKRIYIKRAAAGKKYYVETNHQFIKNFAFAAIPYFVSKIRIIHLKRDPVSVARSFYSINSVPGKAPRGHYYMLDPDEPTNIIRIPELFDGHNEFRHDFYRCIWYWYEIEARVHAMKERYPDVGWVNMTTEELNDKAALRAMFEKLGIPVDASRLERVVCLRENVRVEEKKEVLPWKQCDEMNRKLRTRIEEVYGQGFLSD